MYHTFDISVLKSDGHYSTWFHIEDSWSTVFEASNMMGKCARILYLERKEVIFRLRLTDEAPREIKRRELAILKELEIKMSEKVEDPVEMEPVEP